LLLAAGETLIWAALFYVFATLLLEWEQSLGWAKTDLALGFTIAIAMAAIASPIAGRLIDNGYGRFVLSGGALFGGASLAAISTAGSPLMFWIFWAGIGVAQGFCLYEPCFSVVTRAAGDRARPAITRITLVAGFASPVAFLPGAAITDAYDWQTTIITFALVGAALAAPMLYFGAKLLEDANPVVRSANAKTENRDALQLALRRPQFWLLAIAFPMMALNHGILLNHIMPLLAERQIPRDTAILIASTIGPMQVAGRIVLMIIESRISSAMAAAIAFGGVTIASLILMAAGASPALTFAFAMLQGATYGLTSILKPAMTAEYLGRTGFGAISGWLALPYLAGFAIAPYLGALIWTAGGYDLVIPVTACFGAAGALCVFGLATAGRRR
jgi:MFS family permease